MWKEGSLSATSDKTQFKSLPVRGDLTAEFLLTMAVAILMAALSIIGLLSPTSIYPSDEVIELFKPNDLINLIFGLPILIATMLVARRGNLVGLLLWPGALLYVLYNYSTYVFGVGGSWTMLLFFFLVLLSCYTIIRLLRDFDGEAIRRRLEGAVAERVSGGALLIFGILFLLLALVTIWNAMMSNSVVQVIEIAPSLADIIVSILWIVGGILLLRRSTLGYVSGLGLLFAAIALIIGLILFLLLWPVLTEAVFSPTDVVVVSIMGLIIAIPFALFLRGVLTTEQPGGTWNT